jgi:hypothetical protein
MCRIGDRRSLGDARFLSWRFLGSSRVRFRYSFHGVGNGGCDTGVG